jgi:hypothetical protein
LNTDISQIKQLSVRQENILTELHDQLDEFNLVQKLLSKHTRANRQRIETVQVDTQKQHNLQELKIEGLNALQNNQQEELNSIQALIAELQQEANHINGSINILSRDLEHHANATQVKFKHTAAAIGAVLLLTIAGFSSVKWLPAFAPQGMVEIENNMDRLILDVDSISQVKIQTQEISEHASALENKTSNLQSQVGQIESDFTDLKYEILGPGILSNKTLTPVLPLNDQAWLMQQDSSAYTIQMVGVYSYDDMAIFINDNTSALQDSQLSYTKTNRGQREWFNLFSGVYPTFESALNAIASMPLRLRVNKPWIRNIEEVQNSVN